MPDQIDLGQIVDEQMSALGDLLKFAEDRNRIIPELENILKRLKEENIDGQ